MTLRKKRTPLFLIITHPSRDLFTPHEFRSLPHIAHLSGVVEYRCHRRENRVYFTLVAALLQCTQRLEVRSEGRFLQSEPAQSDSSEV